MDIPDSRAYLSCLVRIWHSQIQNDPRLPDSVQIQVQEIQTGQNHQFDTLDALLNYLESRLFLSSSDT
jgi:hypothetical protein